MPKASMTGIGNADAEEFLDDVKSKVISAIDNVLHDVEPQRAASG
jgi:hypothetical protein